MLIRFPIFWPVRLWVNWRSREMMNAKCIVCKCKKKKKKHFLLEVMKYWINFVKVARLKRYFKITCYSVLNHYDFTIKIGSIGFCFVFVFVCFFGQSRSNSYCRSLITYYFFPTKRGMSAPQKRHILNTVHFCVISTFPKKNHILYSMNSVYLILMFI